MITIQNFCHVGQLITGRMIGIERMNEFVVVVGRGRAKRFAPDADFLVVFVRLALLEMERVGIEVVEIITRAATGVKVFPAGEWKSLLLP